MTLKRVRNQNLESEIESGTENVSGLKKLMKKVKSYLGVVSGSTAVVLLMIFILLQFAVLVALGVLIVLH